MGTGGSGLGRDSGGVKNITDKVKSAIKDLRVQAKSAGYTLKDSKYLKKQLEVDEWDKRLEEQGSKLFPPGSAEARAQERLEAIQEQFNQLEQYRAAIGDNSQMDTNIVYKNLSGADAQTTDENNITVSGIWANENLVHEHTHNLMHTLIEKELGFPKGSIEYKAAYMDGLIEKDIQDTALQEYYRDFSDWAYARSNDSTPFSSDAITNSFARASLHEAILAHPFVNSVKSAAEKSNMRDYATRQYFWAPKGTYIEMPTVAAECFAKCHYNWDLLHARYPYAYYVMREIQKRLKS